LVTEREPRFFKNIKGYKVKNLCKLLYMESDKTNPCIYSSMVFAINATVNYWYGYYIYSAFFVFLLTTSVIYHANKTIYTYVFDKLAILCVVIYGCYLFYKKIYAGNVNWGLASAIILSFLSTIYLYYYGDMCEQFCFSPEKCEQEWFHGLIHLISSVGHLMIVFL
jgi:hypothetical protein